MRRKSGIVGGLALATALLGASEVRGNPQRDASAARPNIVVIETDDQTLEQMKVMDRTRRLLGDEGVTFDNSFVSFSLCCPSRATFLTGQYAHNHGVESNGPPSGGYELDNTNTLPVWLRRAGYVTIHIGKYLNGTASGIRARFRRDGSIGMDRSTRGATTTTATSSTTTGTSRCTATRTYRRATKRMSTRRSPRTRSVDTRLTQRRSSFGSRSSHRMPARRTSPTTP